MTSPGFGDLDADFVADFEKNARIELQLRKQNRIELASNYVIKWKNMSRRVQACTALTCLVFVFMFVASIVSTVLIPFVAINNDSTEEMDLDVQDVHRLENRLDANLTSLQDSHTKTNEKTDSVEKEVACLRTYILHIASVRETGGTSKKDTPEQNLRSCLGIDVVIH